MTKIFALFSTLLVTVALCSPTFATPPSPKQNLAILDEGGSPICGAVLLSPQVVLTAAHCADAAVSVRCGSDDIPAEVSKRDADEDLLTLDLLFPCQAPSVHVAARNPEMGASVYALGFPSRSARMSKGIVSGYEALDIPAYDGKKHKPHTFMATDLSIDPGSSGGGLYDAETGELVGICSMTRGNFGYYSPPQRIRKFLGLK